MPIPDHDCFDTAELVAIAKKAGIPADAHQDVAAALSHAPADARVLIFGSLYLAGAVLAANDQLPD